MDCARESDTASSEENESHSSPRSLDALLQRALELNRIIIDPNNRSVHPVDQISRAVEAEGVRILLSRLDPPAILNLGKVLQPPRTVHEEIFQYVSEKWPAKGTSAFLRKYCANTATLAPILSALGLKPTSVINGHIPSSVLEKIVEKISFWGLESLAAPKIVTVRSESTASTSSSSHHSEGLAPPSEASYMARHKGDSSTSISSEKDKEYDREREKEKEKKKEKEKEGKGKLMKSTDSIALQRRTLDEEKRQSLQDSDDLVEETKPQPSPTKAAKSPRGLFPDFASRLFKDRGEKGREKDRKAKTPPGSLTSSMNALEVGSERSPSKPRKSLF